MCAPPWGHAWPSTADLTDDDGGSPKRIGYCRRSRRLERGVRYAWGLLSSEQAWAHRCWRCWRSLGCRGLGHAVGSAAQGSSLSCRRQRIGIPTLGPLRHPPSPSLARAWCIGMEDLHRFPSNFKRPVKPGLSPAHKNHYPTWDGQATSIRATTRAQIQLSSVHTTLKPHKVTSSSY